MPQIPITDGHLSVYQLLSRLGFTHPGKVWKQLLEKHAAHLPPHIRMQFEMSDGRKSRLMPAIRKEDREQFTDVLRELNAEPSIQWIHLPEEQQVLEVLAAAFQDKGPESLFEANGIMVDLYFHACRVAVFLESPGDHVQLERLEQLEGLRVLRLKVHQKDFRLGPVIQVLRQWMDL